MQVVLCFSPVGSTLRVRSRKFPAIVNCTSIDWFHEWPEEALCSVSYRFLLQAESELLKVRLVSLVSYGSIYLSSNPDVYNMQPELCQSISKFMAYTHSSVNDMSKVYLANERRYNYTTPKSFLELVRSLFILIVIIIIMLHVIVPHLQCHADCSLYWYAVKEAC